MAPADLPGTGHGGQGVGQGPGLDLDLDLGLGEHAPSGQEEEDSGDRKLWCMRVPENLLTCLEEKTTSSTLRGKESNRDNC